jgi:hypothetical protein
MSDDETSQVADDGVASMLALQDRLDRVWKASVTEDNATRWHKLDQVVTILGVKGGVSAENRAKWKVTTEELAARAALEAADKQGGVIPLVLIRQVDRKGAVVAESIELVMPPPAPPAPQSKKGNGKKKEKKEDLSFMQQ